MQEDLNNPHLRVAGIKKQLDEIHNKLSLDHMNTITNKEEEL